MTTPPSDATGEGAAWVPAFPGQRPPFKPGNEWVFQPGNQVAVGSPGPVVHGAWSPRKVDPLAREMVAMVLADPANGHASEPRYGPALWAWARAEGQVQLLTEYLAKAGEAAEDGIGDLDLDRVRTAYLLLHRAEARATTGRTRLGLDPLSATRLGRDRAATGADTARMMAELARLAALGVEVPDVDLGGLGGSS